MILDDLLQELNDAIAEGNAVQGNAQATQPQRDYAEELIRLLNEKIKDGQAINS